MKTYQKLLLSTIGGIAMTTTAWAGCTVDKGRVAILSNDFAALHAVANRAEDCIKGSAKFSKNQTTKHREIQVSALKANPAQYTTAVVANSSIVPLLSEGLIRPLDDLVAKHGQHLQPNQFIRIDGKIMAIAFMANAQHLFYREDILKKAGVKPPKTYEEIIAAAKAIRAKGLMKNPYISPTQVGWNLGEEFVNIYTGLGGEFFKSGTAEPAINNKLGVKALETLKALNTYADPDYLTIASKEASTLWRANQVALYMGWGSGAAALVERGEDANVKKYTRLIGAPTIAGGSTPASTLWWDGFTIAKNISDEDAEATFKAMANGVHPDLLKDHASKAVWLIKGYKPTSTAKGISETAAMGAKPYPMLPYMGILHLAIGQGINDYLTGKESAEKTLSDVETSYITSAKEKGFLK